MLYEAAFLIQPFPIEYLASVVARRGKIQLKFPAESGRSAELKHFIGVLLKMDPAERGGNQDWRKQVKCTLFQIYTHKWILQTMK